MCKVLNLHGEEVTSDQVVSLFTKGFPIYMISHVLGISQADCVSFLG